MLIKQITTSLLICDIFKANGTEAAMGEVRTWGGKQYQKTPAGWVAVKKEGQATRKKQKETSKTVHEITESSINEQAPMRTGINHQKIPFSKVEEHLKDIPELEVFKKMHASNPDKYFFTESDSPNQGGKTKLLNLWSYHDLKRDGGSKEDHGKIKNLVSIPV